MRKVIVFLLFTICAVQVSLAQVFYEKEFTEAVQLIKSDSSLAAKYCKGNASITIHHMFDNTSIKMFIDSLDVSSKEIKKMLKIDKQQYKRRDKLSYKFMTEKFYLSFAPPGDGCMIICFDRMREGYLLAEVTDYKHGLEWENIVGLNRSNFLLFDFNQDEVKYYNIPVRR